MEFKKRTISEIAEMICGGFPLEESHFRYRSGLKLTEFFEDCGTEYEHDGSTRKFWVVSVLEKILDGPRSSRGEVPNAFSRVINHLMIQEDALNEGSKRPSALKRLNNSLQREGFEAFYGDDGCCYLKNTATNTVSSPGPNPHRPFSREESERRELLYDFLNNCSEDDLIERILLPLFRQLGFHRITPSGHRDKALEYGKDIWMKYTLPTHHVVYFGVQTKKGKLDAAGLTKGSNTNIAEVHAQVMMMLGHELFDADLNRRVLVDHAFIVAGGEITKAARNWLGERLDASRRSQIMFMDRDDILNLFVVTNLPMPEGARHAEALDTSDEAPF